MERATPTYTPQAPLAKPLPSGWGKLWAAFGFGVLAYAILVGVELAGTFAGLSIEVDANILLATAEMCAGCVAILFVVALGGKHIARPSLRGMGEAWKAAAWLFVVDGSLVALEVISIAFGYEPIEIAADWPFRVGLLAVLCLGVGLLEEGTMRGLCLNGLLSRMGRTRGGVYGAVILSSLMFGLLHFDATIDFSDSLQLAQNLMKVLQAGMCGFLFAAILVKTRNLWALISIHAANDFMLLFITNGLTGAAVSTEYVHTGDTGLAVLLLYAIMCVLYLPFLFTGKRLIDAASPWRGDFYHYSEAAVAFGPTTPPPTIPVAQAVRPPTTQSSYPPMAHTVRPPQPAPLPPEIRGKHARVPSQIPLREPHRTTAFPQHKENP